MKRALLAFSIAALIAIRADSANEFDHCLLCHGANANGNEGIRAPKLSGMEPWYLARQLEYFASGIRGKPDADVAGHEMGPVGLRAKNEGQIDAAVAFIGKLESKRPAATVKGDVARGKQLYVACASCHGAKGEGNATLSAPALAARSDWYLVQQLVNYQKAVRGTDERDTYGAPMLVIVATLPDEKAVNDVVAYINTLK